LGEDVDGGGREAVAAAAAAGGNAAITAAAAAGGNAARAAGDAAAAAAAGGREARAAGDVAATAAAVAGGREATTAAAVEGGREAITAAAAAGWREDMTAADGTAEARTAPDGAVVIAGDMLAATGGATGPITGPVLISAGPLVNVGPVTGLTVGGPPVNITEGESFESIWLKSESLKWMFTSCALRTSRFAICDLKDVYSSPFLHASMMSRARIAAIRLSSILCLYKIVWPPPR